MNSWPLWALSENPDSLEFLTPALFILGEPIIQPFVAKVQEIPDIKLNYAVRTFKKSQLIL